MWEQFMIDDNEVHVISDKNINSNKWNNDDNDDIKNQNPNKHIKR